MEEKLYFKPEEYGKKKEKPRAEKSEKPNRKSLKLAIFLLFVALIALAILWLIRGKTTISGQYPANVRNESLVCTSNTATYAKVSNVSSDDRELKISMVFDNTGEFSSASLKYTLRYETYGEAYSAEAVSHAQFNLALQAMGYDAGKFNNKFSIIGNELVITLNISSKTSLDDFARSYFMIEYKDDGTLPANLKDYRQNYEAQGFACGSTVE